MTVQHCLFRAEEKRLLAGDFHRSKSGMLRGTKSNDLLAITEDREGLVRMGVERECWEK